MKKLFALILALLMLCACGVQEEPSEIPENGAETEKVIWNIGKTDYEVLVPEKTRLTDDGNGFYQVDSSALIEGPFVMDFSGLSGCEDIKQLAIYANSEGASIIVPNLPAMESCLIYGSTAGRIDLSAAENTVHLELDIHPEEAVIGKGVSGLILGEGFDLSKISGGENITSVTVNGSADLSLIAKICPAEKVYIIGEGIDVSALKNLETLERLSLHGTEYDLSGTKKLKMKTLVLGSFIEQGTVDTFGGSETVTELHINDRCITDISFIEKMPNLKTILLSVDGFQEESVYFWHRGALEKEMLSVLKTNIPTEQLSEFIDKGGEIYLLDDWSRTDSAY